MRPAYSYRPVFVRVLAVVMWALAAGLLANAAITSGGGAFLRALCPTGLLAYGAWLVLWRPELWCDDNAITLRNPLRTIVITWPSVIDIDTRYALTVTTKERRWPAWVAPAPGRGAARQLSRTELDGLSVHPRAGIRPGDLPDSDSGRAHGPVRSRWEEHRNAGIPVPVTVTWNLRAIALGVVLLIGTGLSLLF